MGFLQKNRRNPLSSFNVWEKDFKQEVSVMIYNPNSSGSEHEIQSNIHLQSPI